MSTQPSVLTRTQFVELLAELFTVPLSSEDSLDLTDYLKDSIDVGELLAVLKVRRGIILSPNDFRRHRLLGEVWQRVDDVQRTSLVDDQ